MKGRSIVAGIVTVISVAACSVSGAGGAILGTVVSPSATPIPTTSVEQFATASGVAWALTDTGIFATSAAGASWTRITPSSLDLSSVQAMAVHGRSGWVIALTKDSTGLIGFTTHDGGATWTSRPLPGSFSGSVASVAIDPLDESTISVSIKLPFSPAESLGYALRSIDGGGTWTAMNLPNGEPVRFRTALDGWQAGGAVDQTLSRTQDAGATWQSVAVAIPPAYAGDRAAYSNPVFFGTSGVLPVFLWVPGGGPLIAAFYTTVTAGDRWSLAASVEAAPDGSSMPVVVTGPQSWLVDTNHGLLATTDAKTFSPLAASGLDPSTVATLHATGTTIWAVTSVSSCTVAKTACTTSTWLERSSNNGENWAPSSP